MVLVSVSLTVLILIFVFTGLLSKLNHDLNLLDLSDFFAKLGHILFSAFTQLLHSYDLECIVIAYILLTKDYRKSRLLYSLYCYGMDVSES